MAPPARRCPVPATSCTAAWPRWASASAAGASRSWRSIGALCIAAGLPRFGHEVGRRWLVYLGRRGRDAALGARDRIAWRARRPGCRTGWTRVRFRPERHRPGATTRTVNARAAADAGRSPTPRPAPASATPWSIYDSRARVPGGAAPRPRRTVEPDRQPTFDCAARRRPGARASSARRQATARTSVGHDGDCVGAKAGLMCKLDASRAGAQAHQPTCDDRPRRAGARARSCCPRTPLRAPRPRVDDAPSVASSASSARGADRGARRPASAPRPARRASACVRACVDTCSPSVARVDVTTLMRRAALRGAKGGATRGQCEVADRPRRDPASRASSVAESGSTDPWPRGKEPCAGHPPRRGPPGPWRPSLRGPEGRPLAPGPRVGPGPPRLTAPSTTRSTTSPRASTAMWINQRPPALVDRRSVPAREVDGRPAVQDARSQAPSLELAGRRRRLRACA